MEQPEKIVATEPQKRKKEPVKPWGKKERLLILIIFLGTVLTSVFLAVSSRDYKLPGWPRLNFSLPSFNFLSERTVTIGRQKEPLPESLKAKIAAEFKKETDLYSGTYAFYLVDLESGASFGVNENKTMRAASLIKLPLMLYAQGKTDKANLEAMGRRSDNNVFRRLITQFGQASVQSYIGDLGMAKTSIAENTTTPKETGDLLVKIYRDKNTEILDDLTDTIFENWLAAGVPEGVRVAHKYGREVHVINDAGIIYAPKPFVLVIMTQGVVEREADAAFPELTRMIYSNYEDEN